jgi:hypothetical protein
MTIQELIASAEISDQERDELDNARWQAELTLTMLTKTLGEHLSVPREYVSMRLQELEAFIGVSNLPPFEANWEQGAGWRDEQ